MPADAEIRVTVERFIARRFAKDEAIVEDFAPGATAVGSDADGLYFGLSEIARHFREAMAKSFTLRHAWDRLDIGSNGDTGWFVAHGPAMVGRDGTETPMPVRVSGVLVRNKDSWRFTLLHVSEPA